MSRLVLFAFALIATLAVMPTISADDGVRPDNNPPAFDDGDGDNDDAPDDPAPDDPGDDDDTTTRGNPDSQITLVDKLEGKELEADKQYDAGDRLKVSLLGISFKVPAKCLSAYLSGGLAIVVRSQVVAGTGFILMHTGASIDDVTTLFANDMDLSSIEAGVILKPKGDPTIDGDTLTQIFKDGTYTMHATAIVAKESAAVFFYAGAHADASKCKALVKEMADSAQFAKPADAELRRQWEGGLKGKHLLVYKYKSSSMQGASHSSETTITWDLGSDFAYDYSYHFEGSSSVSGRDQNGNLLYSGGSSGADNAEHTGTWRLEFCLPAALLILTDADGNTYAHAMVFDGQKLWIDGNEAGVSDSTTRR